MRGRSKISLLGHVGQDPRKPSEKNPDFITFSLAVTQKWKDQAGEKQEHTDWYDIVTSQKGLSSLISNYVKKGDPLYIEGTPKYGVYTTNSGDVKPKVTVELKDIELLGQSKSSDEENARGAAQNYSSSNNRSIKDTLDDEYHDSEIPF